MNAESFHQIWIVFRQCLRYGILQRKWLEDSPVLKGLAIPGVIEDTVEFQPIRLPRRELCKSSRLGVLQCVLRSMSFTPSRSASAASDFLR